MARSYKYTVSSGGEIKMIPLVLKVNGSTKNLWEIMEPGGDYGHTEEEKIQYAIKHNDVDLTTLVKSNDLEINSYLRECQDIVEKLRKCSTKYKGKTEMEEDIA